MPLIFLSRPPCGAGHQHRLQSSKLQLGRQAHLCHQALGNEKRNRRTVQLQRSRRHSLWKQRLPRKIRMQPAGQDWHSGFCPTHAKQAIILKLFFPTADSSLPR